MNKILTSVVILIGFLVSGCGMAAVVALTAASGGLFAWQVSDAMKGVDYRVTVEANFQRVWEQALITTQEMNIQILEKKLDEGETNGIITGKTTMHEKIEIVVETVTSNTTNIGIKARKREAMGLAITGRDIDIPFAGTIADNIIKKVSKGCGTGRAIRSKGNQSVIYLVTTVKSNVRARPSTKSYIISTINKGTKLEKIGESREWFKVKMPSGEIGHIFKPLVIELE